MKSGSEEFIKYDKTPFVHKVSNIFYHYSYQKFSTRIYFSHNSFCTSKMYPQQHSRLPEVAPDGVCRVLAELGRGPQVELAAPDDRGTWGFLMLIATFRPTQWTKCSQSQPSLLFYMDGCRRKRHQAGKYHCLNINYKTFWWSIISLKFFFYGFMRERKFAT